jgi:hypothetical protein
MYSWIDSKFASSSIPSLAGHIHVTPSMSFGSGRICFPVIYWAHFLWKLCSILSIVDVITHDSDPYSRTACTTAFWIDAIDFISARSFIWDHFVQGWRAIEWGTTTNHHIATKPTIKHNAEDWGIKLLKINWKYILELWDTWNDEVEGATPEEQNPNLPQDLIKWRYKRNSVFFIFTQYYRWIVVLLRKVYIAFSMCYRLYVDK